MNLKILTLNLHCFAENNVETKQNIIASRIDELKIDVIFLQEVTQSQNNQILTNTNIKSDNYGLFLQELLAKKGQKYYFYYEPIKKSFDIYDEGIGILSKYPLEFVKSKLISKSKDYSNWKTRKALIYKLKLNEKTLTLATTHFGWSDGIEVFEDQFDLVSKDIITNELAILAGDYNIYVESMEYKHIIDKGWFDIFRDQADFYKRPTFRGDDNTHLNKIRIDYIMTNKPVRLINQKILFIEDRVSDHYGVFVMIEI